MENAQMIELVTRGNVALDEMYKIDSEATHEHQKELYQYIAYELAGTEELRNLIGRPGEWGYTDGRPSEWRYATLEDLIKEIEQHLEYVRTMG